MYVNNVGKNIVTAVMFLDIKEPKMEANPMYIKSVEAPLVLPLSWNT